MLQSIIILYQRPAKPFWHNTYKYQSYDIPIERYQIWSYEIYFFTSFFNFNFFASNPFRFNRFHLFQYHFISLQEWIIFNKFVNWMKLTSICGMKISYFCPWIDSKQILFNWHHKKRFQWKPNKHIPIELRASGNCSLFIKDKNFHRNCHLMFLNKIEVMW